MKTAQNSLETLRGLEDHELLASAKNLAQRERELTTQVLRHLAEIERRKLYADLKYPSLFEYAVRELGYSNGAASRRISAMRMVKELPEVEQKIESGALTLCNISRAQTFFREVKRLRAAESAAPALGAPVLGAPALGAVSALGGAPALTREEKSAVLQKLEQKSTREGESLLFALNPTAAASRERVRQMDLERTEFCFTGDARFKAKLQYVRSLLGPRGTSMGLAELMGELLELGIEKLEEKKFGKRRVQAEKATSSAGSEPADPTSDAGTQASRAPTSSAGSGMSPTGEPPHITTRLCRSQAEKSYAGAPLKPRAFGVASKPADPTSDAGTQASRAPTSSAGSGMSPVPPVASNVERNRSAARPHSRYIPQAVKHAVWRSAGGKCSCCGSRNNLQFDHVRPIALGGTATPDNLQLLCGSCNLRRGVKTFGATAMRRS